MKFFNTFLVFCILSLTYTNSIACSSYDSRYSCNNNQIIKLEVFDETSREYLPVYSHQYEQFIAGTPNHKYTINLKNLTNQRVLAVVSVDGVNVITGQTANTQQSGYIIDPYGTVSIDGWRKSQQSVAEFVFSSLSNSYAGRTGRPNNVGVIGVAVFKEQRLPRYQPRPRINEENSSMKDMEKSERQSSEMAGANESSAPAQESIKQKSMRSVQSEPLGTGHGQRRWSPVNYQSFKRESSNPSQTIAYRYDTEQRLRQMGINIPRHYHKRQPNPFPGGFVPDP